RGADGCWRHALRHRAGALAARVDLAALRRREGGARDSELPRGALAAIVAECCRSDAEFIYDDQVQFIAQDADGVDVVVTGGVRRRIDLVVGADGQHSGVRRLGHLARDHRLVVCITVPMRGRNRQSVCELFNVWTARDAEPESSGGWRSRTRWRGVGTALEPPALEPAVHLRAMFPDSVQQ